MEHRVLKDSLNVAGSVASITGVSLLWLKDVMPDSSLAVAVPVYFVASLFGLGVMTLAYLVVKFGYQCVSNAVLKAPADMQVAARLAYSGIAGSIAIFYLGIGIWMLFSLAAIMVRDLPSSSF